jgi:molybdopterin-guanine dinucleotide biosynthesis protein A
VFSGTGFHHARQLLSQSLQHQYSWTIADEIGKLELERKEGLEPAVSELVHHYKTGKATGKLLLVVRDYLLQEVIRHYALKDAVLLNRSFFEQYDKSSSDKLAEVAGLVLCGGQSVRMKRDKALIEYHNKAQCYHVYEMLEQLCSPVFLSCNNVQKQYLDERYQCIIDNATFNDAGPMTGLLSAFDLHPDHAWLTLGCDYPGISDTNMMALLKAREPGYDAVCYYNTASGFIEPLIAVYEQRCKQALLQAYKEGRRSLRHFLQSMRTKTILAKDLHALKSFDTPDDYLSFKQQEL